MWPFRTIFLGEKVRTDVAEMCFSENRHCCTTHRQQRLPLSARLRVLCAVRNPNNLPPSILALLGSRSYSGPFLLWFITSTPKPKAMMSPPPPPIQDSNLLKNSLDWHATTAARRWLPLRLHSKSLLGLQRSTVARNSTFVRVRTAKKKSDRRILSI